MGFWFNPPPPIISATGAQPYAPNKLSPGIPGRSIDNPTPNERQLVNLTVLPIWNPPPVHDSWIHRAYQAYDYAKLNPQITAVPVNNPYPNENQNVNIATILSIWEPSIWDPNTNHQYIHRAGQPYDYAKLSPGIPGQSINNPVPNEDTFVNLSEILSIWNPDIVHNYIHRAKQPYDYAKLAPGIPGQSVDNPPGFRVPIVYYDQPPPLPQTLTLQPQAFIPAVTVQGPYVNQWMVTVVGLWPYGYDLPQLGTKLNPQITAVPVNNPPFYSRTEIPNILQQWVPLDPQPTLLIRSVGNPGWSVDNPIFSRGFVPYPPIPDPLPTLPIRSVGNPGWSVDNPIGVRQPFIYPDLSYGLPQTLVLQPQGTVTVVTSQGPYTNQWLATVIGAWQPSDLQPILAFKLPPQITAVAVNNPPFNSRTELPNILAQWQPPPPLPTPSRRINIIQGGSAPIVTVREWLIRARRRRR